MFPNFPFLPYLQTQTVGLPVTVHSPNVRVMRSALLPQASNVDAFTFPASGCQAEAAFMEEECVDTPKVQMCLRDAKLVGWLEISTLSTQMLYFGLAELCHFLKSLGRSFFCAEDLRKVSRPNLALSPSCHYNGYVTCQISCVLFRILLHSLSLTNSFSRVLDPS